MQMNFSPGGALKPLVFRNTAIQMTAHAVILASGIVMNVVLSRYLGVEAFGRFQYIFAFYYFFMALNDFGVSAIAVREISQARPRAAEILGTVMTFRIVLAVLSIAAAWLITLRLDFPPDVKRALALYGFMLVLTGLQLPAIMFQVEMRPSRPALAGIAAKILAVVFVLAAAALHLRITGIVAALILAESIYTAILWLNSRVYGPFKPTWNTPLIKKILKSAFWLGLSGLLTAAVNRVDFLMLERMTDFRQVGIYAAAYRVTNLLDTLPIILMGTVYPMMAQFASGEHGRLKRVFLRSTLFTGLAGIVLGTLTFAAAPLIVRILFGQEFTPTADCLRILVWQSVLVYCTITGGYLLISLHHEKLNLLLFGLAAVLNVILNWFWIPVYGVNGAAAATVAAYLLIFAGTFICAWKFTGEKKADPV